LSFVADELFQSLLAAEKDTVEHAIENLRNKLLPPNIRRERAGHKFKHLKQGKGQCVNNFYYKIIRLGREKTANNQQYDEYDCHLQFCDGILRRSNNIS